MRRKDALNRLCRIEGQLRGIQRMIEEGRSCQEVFTQLAAATAALRRATYAYFADRLGECTAAGQQDDLAADRLVEMFVKMG